MFAPCEVTRNEKMKNENQVGEERMEGRGKTSKVGLRRDIHPGNSRNIG